jgi:hypothetical protein
LVGVRGFEPPASTSRTYLNIMQAVDFIGNFSIVV